MSHRQTADRRRPRIGTTLIELLVAMTLLLIIIGSTVPFFRTQARALATDAARFDARQTSWFASDLIERELRAAGAGLGNYQPMLVQAHEQAITFNADLVTSDAADVNAASYDATADTTVTVALPATRRITLPLSAAPYPDSTYLSQGIRARAETISYWTQPDSTPGRRGRYVLFRRVNDAAPTVVARNLLLSSTRPLFRYFTLDAAGQPVEVTTSRLPLVHTPPLHGWQSDTGRAALLDSVRIVRIAVTVVEPASAGGRDSTQSVERSIRLTAAPASSGGSCGRAPAGTVLAAGAQSGAQVSLTWNASADEWGGERDVERYLLYRRPAGGAIWGEPIAGIPAGATSYSYVDRALTIGQSWVYGILAQDCSFNNSALSASGAVTVLP
jgi:hypothetical protein